MTLRKLKPPEEWISQALKDRHPDLLRKLSVPLKPLKLTLCVRRNLSEFNQLYGVNLDELRASVSFGCELVRRGDSSNPYYILFSAAYTLIINPFIGRSSGNHLAFLSKVSAEDKILDPKRVVSVDFDIMPLEEEPSCNIAEIYGPIERQRQAESRLAKHRGDLISRMNQPQIVKVDQRDIDLHAESLREYGALRLLLKLLHIRDEELPQPNAIGIVTAVENSSDSKMTSIQMEVSKRSNGQLSIDDQVILSMSGSDRELRAIIEDIQDGNLFINTKGFVQLTTGLKIRVSKKPHYQYGRHEEALKAFLQEDVAGCWDDLVTLLCKPSELLGIEANTPESWLSEHALNNEQKLAVAGAVSAPVAFFIQGPPGTGKTTVICEIIRQLASKGERILLVASAHVAVDEVLRRIGAEKGIFPMRVTWDPNRVDEDLRGFTFQQLSNSLTEKIKSGAIEQGSLLEHKLETSLKESKEIATLERLRSKRDQAREFVKKAKSDRERFYSDTNRDIKHKEKEISDLSISINQRRRSLAGYKGHFTKAEKHFENVSSRKSGIKRIVSGLVGELARSRKAVRKAEENIRHAQSQLDDDLSSQKRLQQKLRKNVELLQSKGKKLDGDLSLALQKHEEAKQKWKTGFADSPYKTVKEFEQAIQIIQKKTKTVSKLKSYKKLNTDLCSLLNTESNTKDLNGNISNDLSCFLLQGVNLVCATTEGIAGSPHVRDHTFDTLIVDESSRVTDAQLLISAIRARRCILVGDENQLPPYFGNKDEYHLHALCALMMHHNQGVTIENAVEGLAEIWEAEDDAELHAFRRDAVLDEAKELLSSGSWKKHYLDLLDSEKKYYQADKEHQSLSKAMLCAMREKLITSYFSRAVTEVHPSLRQRLVEQRRMIKPIARIVSEPVYGGDYITPPSEELAKRGISPLVTDLLRTPITFIDTTAYGREAEEKLIGNGFVNEVEIQHIQGVCSHLDEYHRKTGVTNRISVSILCFYKAQARRISERLGGYGKKRRYNHLQFNVIDAIDRIQGQESDVVVISFCRARPRGIGEGFGKWLQDMRRLNVAMTRARRALILVGHGKTLRGLRTFERSKLFYEHLFNLFETHSDVMTTLKKVDWRDR